MINTQGSGYGGHTSNESISGAALLAAFIPALITTVTFISIFLAIRNTFPKIYAPRTFLGTVPEKDRTPQSTSEGNSLYHDFRALSDRFVLQHNSLDAYLYLRFLKFIAGICLLGCCMIWPILLPIHVNGGGKATQLDRLSFSNIARNDLLWAHLVVAWGFFFGIIILIAWERLKLIGIRQAYLLDDSRASRLSARTVLFLNVKAEACQTENLKSFFGSAAERSWPVKDTGDLDNLIATRNGAAYALENAELDFIVAAAKGSRRKTASRGINGLNGEEDGSSAHKQFRPTKRSPPIVGSKFDPIDKEQNKIAKIVEKIEAHRVAPSRNIPERSAIFVAFTSQAAAHRAHQTIKFTPKLLVEDRHLAVQPKEVLWKNLAMPPELRLSKASLGLVFVIAFTIFFSIPVGIIGTISNAKYLAKNVSWLEWINDLPPVALGLLTGLLPPYLVSWFTKYVPKLFRHIAKLSGEPTTSQAELKTQAWYFVFQVFQIFLVTTFSSGAAAVAVSIAKEPQLAPTLLAEALPKASNFYLTYFILQGTANAADTILNYSDLFEYLFYEYFWDKSPREKFSTYGQMRGTPWASWYPKFTNFLVIAIAYSCVAPLVTGFAAVGIFLYYLTYRHQLLYVCQTKVDTKGEAYKRALQQMPTGIYLAQLALIGLFGARKAAVHTTLMIVTLVVTALINLALDRTLRPLELYLGMDVWQELEVPQLADEDGIDYNDEAALHAASHGRRLGIGRLPSPAPRILSDFFDGIITTMRIEVESWLEDPSIAMGPSASLKEEDIAKAYTDPALTSGTPKLWLPRDQLGVSKHEIDQNEALGLVATDEGAEIDEKGRLIWDHRFENVPIWKAPQAI